MLVTQEQAREYLSNDGFAVPALVLDAFIARLGAVQDCLDEHYDEPTALLIQLYLIALFSAAGGFRYISSQTAPSGASRSFRHADIRVWWRGMLALLRGLDTHGCVSGLIPDDPTQTAFAGIWVARGDCDRRR